MEFLFRDFTDPVFPLPTFSRMYQATAQGVFYWRIGDIFEKINTEFLGGVKQQINIGFR